MHLLLAIVLLAGCRSARTGDSARARGATDTLHYTVIRGGSEVARTVAWTDGSGSTTVRTVFPTDTIGGLVTQLRHDLRQRLLLSLVTTGRDSRGAPVHEQFTREGSAVSWTSPPENGRREGVSGGAYLPVLHAKWEAMLPTLTRAERPTQFLPRGQAWLEAETTLVVFAGAARQSITQYRAHGLTPAVPERVWLDTAGRLFSDGEIVRAGWAAVLPQLQSAADRAGDRERQRLVRTLRRVPDRPVVIQGARLFDAETRTVVEGATVIVRDSTIVTVGRDGTVPLPPNAEKIDAAGRMLLPGLWDMHAHDYGDLPGEMRQLAAGVTSIREMVVDTLTALRFARRPASEVAFAPRVFWAGIVDGPGGVRRDIAVTSDSAARVVVRRYAALGASQIKLYARLHRSFVDAAVDEARRQGLRAGGHLARGLSAMDAVAAGYAEISHLPYLTAGFGTDTTFVPSARALWRGVQNAAALDLTSDSVRRLTRLLVEHDVAIDATLAFVEPSVRTADLLVRKNVAPELDRLPAGMGRGYVGWHMVVPHDSLVPIAGRGMDNLERLLLMLHASGVALVAGTDDLAGFTLRRELEIYVEAGIDPKDVLYLATLGAARRMGAASVLGSIQAGKRADLVLVDGDPLRRMNDIGRVVLTMKNGALYDPAALYRAMGFAPCCGAAR